MPHTKFESLPWKTHEKVNLPAFFEVVLFYGSIVQRYMEHGYNWSSIIQQHVQLDRYSIFIGWTHVWIWIQSSIQFGLDPKSKYQLRFVVYKFAHMSNLTWVNKPQKQTSLVCKWDFQNCNMIQPLQGLKWQYQPRTLDSLNHNCSNTELLAIPDLGPLSWKREGSIVNQIFFFLILGIFFNPIYLFFFVIQKQVVRFVSCIPS